MAVDKGKNLVTGGRNDQINHTTCLSYKKIGHYYFITHYKNNSIVIKPSFCIIPNHILFCIIVFDVSQHG